MNLTYRKEVDGLRALAILPVIWTHAGLPFIEGGFLGVDVFFVISGFLITSIIVSELQTKNFSIQNFYERRARRILPALVVMVTVTALCIPFISADPKYLTEFGKSVLSGVFFYTNIHFWQTSGYFGSASELSPLLHLWSLAVEEQFYILFPLFLIAVFKVSWKLLPLLLIFSILTSLFVATLGSELVPIASFYLLPTRAWELLLGALSAVIYSSIFVEKVRQNLAPYLSVFGLVLILSSYFLFSPSTLHPSYLTIPAVFGTCLILLFASGDCLVSKLLSNKPTIFVGLISYSLYLWHQPILALLKKYYSLHLDSVQIAFAISLTFLISIFCWKYVEAPFRNKQKFPRKTVYTYSILSLAFMGLISILYIKSISIMSLIYPKEMGRFQQYLEADDSHTNQMIWDDECKFLSNRFDVNFEARYEKCSAKFGKSVFVIGGSHGIDLYNAIAMNTDYPFVVSVSRGFCRAHSFIGGSNKTPKCQYEDFKVFLEQHSKSIHQVIYTQTPDRLFSVGSMTNAKESHLEVNLIEQVSTYLGDLKAKYNVDILMIGMLPPLAKHPIEWDIKRDVNQQLDEIISINAIQMTEYVDRMFQGKLQQKGIPYVTKIDGFSLNLFSDLVSEGKITYSDKRHLSTTGEKLFGSRLLNYLNENKLTKREL